MRSDISNEPTLADLIAGLWHDVWLRRRLFFVVLLISLIASVIGVLLVAPRYRAKATIMPPVEQGRTSSLLSSFGSLAGLGNLGAGTSASDLYPVVSRSQRIITGLLARPYRDTTIQDVLLNNQPADSTNLYILRLGLQDNIEASKSLKTGIVTIGYVHNDRYFAAEFVNSLLAEMEAYFEGEMVSSTHNQKVQLEQRLAGVRDSLRVQEIRVQDFLIQNRDSRQSPRLAMLENRLRRNLEISSGVYLELMRQYELIKIQDGSEEPALRVLDRATVPMIRFWPERRKFVLLSLVGAFFLTLMWIKLAPAIRRK